ncbi:MAG: glycosyltransferase family 39 protein [Acidobacteria bacterium]|nr:glycosyltransferase family 39 protein [Acidobacteriota bacterium]MCA1642529.1 glycosyltransferase family 39 protein [Acidobacteriota bacterium]
MEKILSAPASTITTARLCAGALDARREWALSRTLVASILALVVVAGFGFRATRLGTEGLSEDELNKLRAVEDYRARGLTSANGEHPMLMKALLTASVVACEKWNATGLAQGRPSSIVSVETALRLPGAIFGALTSLLIFLVVSELFGTPTALVAAALWAFDPTAAGFNRIAKEDSFYLFFFLLASFFWLRGQRAAESNARKPEPFYWAAAASFGAMLASKYLPHMFGIAVSYYWVFQGVPSTRWRLGKKKWLAFFVIMGAAFVACNPTILLPATLHEMRVFAGEHRIGHDSYEFLGRLYPNQVTLWFKGSPWYFYYAFMAFKLPLAVVVAFVVGLPVLFTKRLGDGRYFLLFWLFFWFLPFTVMGGKFTRYFTLVLPAVLMTAAIGMNFAASRLARLWSGETARSFAYTSVALFAVTLSAYASASAAPHYRLYTNALGGGAARAGSYFPHDEFYDASTPEIAARLARLARPGARVASETPDLFDYYVRRAGRDDLSQVSLSDQSAVRALSVGDAVAVARGRRYFSNDATAARLEAASRPAATVSLGSTPSAQVFMLDESALAAIRGANGR